MHQGRPQSVAGVSFVDHAVSRKDGQHLLKPMVTLPKSGWDDSGVQHMMLSSMSSRIGSDEEEQYWKEQDRLRLEAQHHEACKDHLAWYSICS